MEVSAPSRHERGAALLLVLWMIVLLTGLISVFALTARIEGLQGRYLGRSTVVRQGAEAGIEVAVLHLQGDDPSRRWVPDGRPNGFAFEGQQIQVRILDEAAKVDLNVAPPDLLVALLVALGQEQQRARQLSGAIQDWRDEDGLINVEGGAEDPQYASARLPYGAKDRPFESLSELRLVLGMDPTLYAKLLPFLTIYSGQASPNPDFAPGPVLQALGLPPEQVAEILAAREGRELNQGQAQQAKPVAPLAASGSGTYSISSRATRPDGTRVQIQAAIRMGGGAGFGQLYLPLSWRVGESD